MAKANTQHDRQSQSEKFKEAAREVEADDDEKRFDERLKRVAKPKTRNGEASTDEPA